MERVTKDTIDKQACILVVDDDENNRDLLSRRLEREGHDVVLAENGMKALENMRTQAVDLVMLDIMMPGMDGYAVLEHMKDDPKLVHLPVVMVSAITEMESVAHCIERGADDYLPKPVNPVLLRARVNSCLEKRRMHDQEVSLKVQLEDYSHNLEEKVREQVEEISSAQRATIFATSKLAESKDPETGAHLDRMREYCKLLSIEMSLNAKFADILDQEFIDTIYAASPLHDIGKVGVPDDILLKRSKLDDDEWVVMKAHTTIGSDTLRAVDTRHKGNNFIRMGIEIAESHHEKWDGSGYPNNISGEDIPLSARMLALADVYDALTSERCYKNAFTHEKSKQIILEGDGSHFDPDVVKAFLAIEEKFIEIKNMFKD